MKTTIQILYDKGLFNIFINVGEILKYFLLVEDIERRRSVLEELKDDNDVIQWFCP